MSYLEGILLQTTVQEGMYALAVGGAVLAVLWLIRSIMWRWFDRRQRTTKFNVDKLIAAEIRNTHFIFLLILATFVGLSVIWEPYSEDSYFGPLQPVLFITILVQLVVWVNVLINHWLANYKDKNLQSDAASVTTVSVMGFLAKLVLYVVLLLLILQNLGVQVGALLASLGVAGIAIGLAAQSVLGDLFASLAIVLDKPFAIGDFVIVDDKMGTIENIGLKTTRVRSLSGEQIIISNSDLLSARIRNYKRMSERRVVFAFGVTYQTPPDKLRQAQAIVKETIEGLELTRFDRAHFYRFGDSSLDFEVVFFMLDPDYAKMMDTLQTIHLTMMERFAELGIEFAYPTRTLYVQKSEPEESAAELMG